MSVCRPRHLLSLRPRGRAVFAIALGVSAGILNAVILASATVLRGHGVNLGLGARLGVVALCSTVLTVFVAEYAEYRFELIRAERQLLFTQSERLAATSLRRAVLREAVAVASLAVLASFVGAALPLAIGAWFLSATWLALMASVAALAVWGRCWLYTSGGGVWRG